MVFNYLPFLYFSVSLYLPFSSLSFFSFSYLPFLFPSFFPFSTSIQLFPLSYIFQSSSFSVVFPFLPFPYLNVPFLSLSFPFPPVVNYLPFPAPFNSSYSLPLSPQLNQLSLSSTSFPLPYLPSPHLFLSPPLAFPSPLPSSPTLLSSPTLPLCLPWGKLLPARKKKDDQNSYFFPS